MWTINLPVEAFLFGCLSSASFPLGALGGLLSTRYWSKELQRQSAALMIAFACGCLLCAVTVEIFAASVERTLEVVHAERDAARRYYADPVPRHELPRDVVERSMGAESGNLEHGDTGKNLQIQCIVLIVSTLVGAILYIFLNRILKSRLESTYEDSDAAGGTSWEGRRRIDAEAAQFTMEYRRVYRRWRLKDFGVSSRPSIPGSPGSDTPTNYWASDEQRDHHVLGHPEDTANEKNRRYLWVGLAIFLGQCIDGVPECILIGIMVMRKEVSVVLLAALFVTNLPEGFSSTQLVALHEEEDKKGQVRKRGIGAYHLLGMWVVLSLLTGVGAAVVVMIFQANFPTLALTAWDELVCACVEGLAGGAMLAMIATVMLPASYNEEGDGIGIACVFGFCCAVLIKLVGQLDDPDGVPLDIPNVASDERRLRQWGYQPHSNEISPNPEVHLDPGGSAVSFSHVAQGLLRGAARAATHTAQALLGPG